MNSSRIRSVRESVLPAIRQVLRRSALVVCVAWPLSVAGHAHGQDVRWNGGDGKWDEAENWLPKRVPGGADNVRIEGGTVRIVDGVTAGSRDANLGVNAGTTGAIAVDGPGARWGAAGAANVGYNGSGTVTISGGAIGSAGGTLLGWNRDASGEIQVSGNGSSFSTGNFTLGYVGEGKMRIEGGGRVQSPANSGSWDVNLGYQRGGKGEATISGAGSVWELGRVVTGYFGQGSIHVQDGGAVRSGAVALGGTWYGAGGGSGHTGSGIVEVVGKGSSWTSSDSLTVGGASASALPSTLSVSGGGTFSSASGAIIGSDYSSRGSVLVDGPGSHWSAGNAPSGLGADFTIIGNGGEGSLTVRNGGQAGITSTYTILGRLYEGTGEVTVSGPGSLLSSTGPIHVSGNGTAKLTVEDGGKVTAPYLSFGGQTLFNLGGNSINLNGGDSPESRGIIETGYLAKANIAAFSGPARVNFDGGILRATGDQANFIQSPTTPVQPDVIIGPRGAYIDTNGFQVGIARPLGGVGGLTKLGEGTLTLSEPGRYQGATAVEQGTLQLAAPRFASGDNRLPTGSALVVGNTGDTGSAAVNLNGWNQEVAALSSLGTSMSRAVTNAAATPSTLTVNQAVDTTFGGQLTGNLSLVKLGGGTLTLTGENTLSGVTSVNGGTLAVDGSLAGEVAVGPGGLLRGTGTFGSVTVAEGGVFSPGNSPGLATVLGDLTLFHGATYLVDLFGTTAGTGYDRTNILGSLTLDDPILSLNLGFAPAPGDTFTIFSLGRAGGLFGTFDGLGEGALLDVDGLSFRITYRGGTGNDVVLSFAAGAAAVPEPGGWILLLSGVGLVLIAARRPRLSWPVLRFRFAGLSETPAG